MTDQPLTSAEELLVSFLTDEFIYVSVGRFKEGVEVQIDGTYLERDPVKAAALYTLLKELGAKVEEGK